MKCKAYRKIGLSNYLQYFVHLNVMQISWFASDSFFMCGKQTFSALCSVYFCVHTEFLPMVLLLHILVLRWLHCVVRWHCWHTCFLRPQGHEQLTQGVREPPSVVSLSDLLACCVWSRTGGIRFTLVLCDQSSQITAQVRPLTIKHRI